MPIRVVTPASALPVSLVTAMRHLRALDNDADLVKLYLEVATHAVEDYTGRALTTKTYCLELDSWPNYRSFWPTFRSYVPTEIHPLWNKDNLRALELRRTPLISIDSVKYYSSDLTINPAGTTLSTFDAANYRADVASMPGRLVFEDNGVALPDIMKRHDAVQIQFQAGSGAKESGVPAMLRMAVLTFAHHLFDNRVAVSDQRFAPEMPFSLRYMLRAMRVDSITQVK